MRLSRSVFRLWKACFSMPEYPFSGCTPSLPGMCAIFTRDRLDHRRGCAPSPAMMKYVLSCFVFGVCKRLCFSELQEQDSVSANSWRCILVLLLNYLSNINYVNWLMGLILCCFSLMFAIVNQARFYSCFKY